MQFAIYVYIMYVAKCYINSKLKMKLENLKEKLPQAFMQIGWMEDDFRNITAKVWVNLGNQEMWFFKGFINCLYVALSGGTLLIYVMSQQYNRVMDLYTHKKKKKNPFNENVSSLFFYT